MDRRQRLERRIRVLLTGFAIGIVLSGVTAFPLTQELTALSNWLGAHPGDGGLKGWIATVRDALAATDAKYPFLAYGYDWLAFGHLMIAAAFYGPIKDPIRNVFIVKWGIFCCLATFPIILICGPLRGIPVGWQFVDSTFGIIGCIPLYFVLRDIRELERGLQTIAK